MEDRYSSTELAERFGVARNTLTHWADCLGLEPLRVFDRRLFNRDEAAMLEQFAAKRRAERQTGAEPVVTP